jgi:transcriptional regulator with XRE-family HTH domain
MNDTIEGEVVPGSEEDAFYELPRLGQLLRHYRRRAGLSQRLLAMESQVEQSNISLIERGDTRNPWNSTLETLATTIARHIPGITARQIADRLIEAKTMKPADYYGVDPQAVMLSDRLATHPARVRRLLYELMNRVADTFEELLRDKPEE